MSGSFMGLLLGGVLAPSVALVFLVSVPFGLFGTVQAYLMSKDNGVRTPARIDLIMSAPDELPLSAIRNPMDNAILVSPAAVMH